MLIVYYLPGQLEIEVSSQTQILNAKDAELAAAKEEVSPYTAISDLKLEW